jgi:hypothetical protein
MDVFMMRITFAFLLAVLLSYSSFASEQKDQIPVAPHEPWVNPQSLPVFDSIPLDKINNGAELVNSAQKIKCQSHFLRCYAPRCISDNITAGAYGRHVRRHLSPPGAGSGETMVECRTRRH